MKKQLLLTFIAVFGIISISNAQLADSVIFYPNLDTSTIEIQDVKLTYPADFDMKKHWYTVNAFPPDSILGFTPSGTQKSVKITGYTTTDYYEMESWLVIPNVDLRNFTNAKLTFANWTRYFKSIGVDSNLFRHQLDVMVSTNYVDDVSTAAWDPQVKPQVDTLDQSHAYDNVWVNSTLDLSAFEGNENVTIGLKFHIDQTGTVTTTERPGNWIIAQIRLTGDYGFVTSITVSSDAYNDSLAVGSTCNMSATVEPADAVDKTVVWSVDQESIATIDASTGILTAVANGIVNITATNAASGVTGTYAIEVFTPEVDIPVTSITVSSDATGDSAAVGATVNMVAAILPENATNRTIAWSVDDASIATIDAATGVLTTVAAGTVVVTATNDASGVTGTKDIKVYTPTSSISTHKDRDIKILPNISNGKFRVLLGENSGLSVIKVYNMAGIPVASFETMADEISINLQSQPLGLYILNVSVNNKNYFEKVIIKE